MTALDVGYGDAILLLLPDGSTCLVDAGGAARRRGYGSTPRFDPGEEVVSSYLWERGVGRVDLLILSTPERASSRGPRRGHEEFSCGELWVPGGLGNESSRKLLALARERDIPIRSPLAGEDFERGGATISVLWPDGAPAGNSRRADSLVFKIKWRETEILLAGDIRKADEEKILARLEVDQTGCRCAKNSFARIRYSFVAEVPGGRTAGGGRDLGGRGESKSEAECGDVGPARENRGGSLSYGPGRSRHGFLGRKGASGDEFSVSASAVCEVSSGAVGSSDGRSRGFFVRVR